MLAHGAILLGPAPVPLASRLCPGGHVVALYPGGQLDLRMHGLEIRDALLVLLPQGRSLTAALGRLPLSEGTVAGNVLKHGTGALNIAASRVGYQGDMPSQETWNQKGSTGKTSAHIAQKGPGMRQAYADGLIPVPDGRFPANLLLVHDAQCQLLGTRQVTETKTPSGYDRYNTDLQKAGYRPGAAVLKAKPVGGEVTREQPVWACADGCPVLVLDRQSGHLHVRGNTRPTLQGGGNVYTRPAQLASSAFHYDEGGGASRFFPQVASLDEALGWMRRLIVPAGGDCLLVL